MCGCVCVYVCLCDSLKPSLQLAIYTICIHIYEVYTKWGVSGARVVFSLTTLLPLGLSEGNIEISFWSRSDTTAGAVKGMSPPYNVTFARQFPNDHDTVFCVINTKMYEFLVLLWYTDSFFFFIRLFICRKREMILKEENLSYILSDGWICIFGLCSK